MRRPHLGLHHCRPSAGCQADFSPISQSFGGFPSSDKPTDPAEVAKAEAIATYVKYWDEMEKSYATGRVEGTDIKKFAAGAALARPEAEVPKIAKAGRAFTGEVGISTSTVTKADLDREVPSVTLSSCIDVTKWIPLDRKSGQPAALPSERLTRFVALTTLEKWPDGWKVLTDEPQTGRPC